MVVGSGASLSATGTGAITATAVPATGLTGTTLASGVTASSLTSVGTLTGLTVSGTTSLTGTTNVNTSGNATTSIGTGGTGQVSIGSGTNSVVIGNTEGISIDANGHIKAVGTIPTGTNCTLTAGSTDIAGQANVTATPCTITFAVARAAAPFCAVAQSGGTAGTFLTATTTTTLVLSSVANGEKYSYVCFGW